MISRPGSLLRALSAHYPVSHPGELSGVSGAYDGALASAGPWGLYRYDASYYLPRKVMEGRIHPQYPSQPWRVGGEGAWVAQPPTGSYRMPFEGRRLAAPFSAPMPDGMYGPSYTLDISADPLGDGRISLYFLNTETTNTTIYKCLVEVFTASGSIPGSAAFVDFNAANDELRFSTFVGDNGRSPTNSGDASYVANTGDSSYLGWVSLSRILVPGGFTGDGAGLCFAGFFTAEPITAIRVSILQRCIGGVWSPPPNQLAVLGFRITRGSTNLATLAECITSSTGSGSAANMFDGSFTTFWQSSESAGNANGVAYVGQRFAKRKRITNIHYRNHTASANNHPNAVQVLYRLYDGGPILSLGKFYAIQTASSGVLAGWNSVELPFGVPSVSEIRIGTYGGLNSNWRVSELMAFGDDTWDGDLSAPIPAGLDSKYGAWVPLAVGPNLVGSGGSMASRSLAAMERALSVVGTSSARLQAGDVGMWGKATLTWGSVLDTASAQASFTLPGAMPGDPVEVTPPPEIQAKIAVTKAEISAPNVCTVTLTNFTGGTITPNTGEWIARAMRGSL